MSDFMHVPILVKYHQESHAAAGALLGLGVDWYLGETTHMNKWWRIVTATGTSLIVGYAKEHIADHNAHNSEIPPWGWGAGLALGFKYTVRW